MNAIQAAPIPHLDPIPLFSEPVKTSVIDVQPKLEKPMASALIASAPTPLPVSSPLGDLSSVERLLITKRLRVKSVLSLRGKKNRFFVRTPDNKMVYTVEEENSWWVGYICYGLRPLQLKVSNSQGEEIMTIDRPYACTGRVMPCQLQRLKIYSPPGNEAGTVEQVWTLFKPLYVVKNRAGEIVFWIYGPYITVSCYNDVKFSITRADGTPVGGTCKRWQGLTHALFFAPVTDKFGIAFDVDLTVEEKALLLAATLLMDYMYYDS